MCLSEQFRWLKSFRNINRVNLNLMNFKNFILSTFAAILLVVAIGCEPNGKSGTTGNCDKIGELSFCIPTVDVLNGEGNPTPTVELEGHMQHLVTHNSPYWWVDGYVSSRDDTRDRNRGKWYRFYNNGTFQYGIFQENDGIGTWKYDLLNETIYMKSKDGSETMQWRTMMAKTNEKTVFIGPEVGPNKGDQAMLQPYLQKPAVGNITW